VGLTKADAVVLALVLQSQDTAIEDVLCIGAPKMHFSYEWIEQSLLPWLKNKYPSAPIRFKAPFRSNYENRNLMPFKDFFLIWGIKNVQVMDIDEYEGADHLFDLNQPECPSGLHSKFDLIVDGGSLEHCFNLPNALNSIGTMLRENGVVFHTNPANLMIDHGFFQISPTLYSDYYAAAGFDLLYGGLSHTSTKIFTDVKIDEYSSDIYRSKSGSSRASKLPRLFVLFAAKKTAKSISPNSVVQNYYKKMHSGEKSEGFVLEYKINTGGISIRRKIIQTSVSLIYSFIVDKGLANLKSISK
jgi:SAM-dependent methyltransferase